MLPGNRSRGVDDEDVGIGIASGLVEYSIGIHHFGWLIIQYRKLQSQGFDCETGLRKIVNTDCQNLGVQIGKL